MKWSSIAMIGCVLLLGFMVGRGSSPPAPVAQDTQQTQALAESGTDARTGSAKNKQGKRKGFSFDGVEFQNVKSLDDLDSIERTTLLLRQTQPTFFLGVPLVQIPSDNWLMAELIFQIKPDYIIETGTAYGGSSLFYAAILELVNPDGKIITVDINKKNIRAKARDTDLWKRHVKFILGSSTDPEVIEQIEAEVGKGKKVLVTLDTLHAPNHVSNELELYSSFVSKGSYIIVQDTFFEGLAEAIDGFLASHPAFRQDVTLDQRFVFTKYRGGFLKRQ